MKRLRVLNWALAFLVTIKTASAQSSTVDWQYFGDNDDATIGRTRCFFNYKGITYTPESYIRVWTKCLPQKAMDAVDVERDFGGQIFKAAVARLASPYDPPWDDIEKLDDRGRSEVIMWEETADIAEIKPDAQIYYEANCSSKMLRSLSVIFNIQGKIVTSQVPSEWDYLPPESDGAWLMTILCPPA